MTTITAILLNYFCAGDTLSAVQSLLPDAEKDGYLDIYVVDNSANNDEAACLRDGLDKRTQLILNAENIGFGRGCNQIYRQTQSDYVLLLNPDARLLPSALVLMHRFMEKQSDVGAVGPLVYWDDNRHFLLPPNAYPHRRRDLLREKSRRFRQFYSWLWRCKALRYWAEKRPLELKFLSGGHVLLRRSAIEKAGGLFDPGYFMYFEDTDLFLRLRKAGSKLFMLPTAQAIHQFGGTAKDRAAWKQELFAESARLFSDQHRDWRPMEWLMDFLSNHLPDAPQAFNGSDLGELATPLSLELPDCLHNGWLAEWALQADFCPAAGWQSEGTHLTFSESLWHHLPDGDHFLRISRPGIFGRAIRQYRWRTKCHHSG